MTGFLWSSQAEDLGVTRVLNSLDHALDSASLGFWMQGEAKQHVSNRAAARFGSEGDDVSGPWAPLSPVTIADRLRQQYGSGPILHRSGGLEDYIVNASGSMTMDPSGVTFQTPEPTGDPTLQAKFNTAQTGARGAVPARPVIGLNETDAATLLNSLAMSIQAAIEGGIL